MNYEIIKTELESEVEMLLNLSENKTRRASGMDKLKANAEHFGKADAFSNKVIDKLNEILQRHQIEFKNEEEKSKFNNFISPIVKNSITRFLRN